MSARRTKCKQCGGVEVPLLSHVSCANRRAWKGAPVKAVEVCPSCGSDDVGPFATMWSPNSKHCQACGKVWAAKVPA